MYAIYGNIYHQYTPNGSIYTSTMDPMGYVSVVFLDRRISSGVLTADAPLMSPLC